MAAGQTGCAPVVFFTGGLAWVCVICVLNQLIRFLSAEVLSWRI
jgi:hypothetical protein